MSDPSETRTASSTGGEKGVKLARYDLMPVSPLEEVASRFGLGALKYENRNWERGYEWSKSYGALQRHLNAFWRGEEDDDLGEEAYRAAGLDPEDFKVEGRIPGSSHLAAAACHILFLLEWSETHPEFDDRVKPKPPASRINMERLRKAAMSLMPTIPVNGPLAHYTMKEDGEVVENWTGRTVIPCVSAHEDEESSMRDSLQFGLDRDQRS